MLTIDWRDGAFLEYIAPGAFGRFLGFWKCCCQAVFAYASVELVGVAAEECERQRITLPKAVRRVAYRIIFYYVAAAFVLGLNVSANDPVLRSNLSKSYAGPFVLMLRRAGIPGLPNVVNAVGLIASISVANANMYITVFGLVLFN